MTISGQTNWNSTFLTVLPPLSNSSGFVCEREVRFQWCFHRVFPTNAPIRALSFFGEWNKRQAAPATSLFTCTSPIPYLAGLSGVTRFAPLRDGGEGQQWLRARLKDEVGTGPAISYTFHLTQCQALPPPLMGKHALIKEAPKNTTGVVPK